MSGRRYKNSKFHSRSYSKPLFDPQRLLYFSTTNQRIGKVIRPKSEAVSNQTLITKDRRDQVLDSLNETKSFRITKNTRSGMPVAFFNQTDDYESISIPGLYFNQGLNWVLSYPFGNMSKQGSKMDRFLKNFQPYTPSLCYPLHIQPRLGLDITNKKAGDTVEYYWYLLTKSDLQGFDELPDEDAQQSLLPFVFYHISIPLNAINKNTLFVDTDSTFIVTWVEENQQHVPIKHFQITAPTENSGKEEGNYHVYEAINIETTEEIFTPDMNQRIEKFLRQQLEKNELYRYMPPFDSHLHISLIDDLYTPFKESVLEQLPNDYLFMCCSTHVHRTTQDQTLLPCSVQWVVEGYEVNPHLIGQ